MELKDNSIKIAIFCVLVIATDYYRGDTSTGNPIVFFAAHEVKNLNWPEANQLAVCEELNLGRQ